METLSVLDQAFWAMEDEHTSLHIGALAIFDGPMPARAELVARYRERANHLPHLRDRLARPRLGIGRAHWERDGDVDLDYHVRESRLPSPGSDAQLHALVGRILSYPLDRTRPLWEAWLVDGLDEGRWALVLKIHHSAVDGLAGMAAFTTLLDEPVLLATKQRPRSPSRVRDASRVAVALAGSAVHPRRTARVAGQAVVAGIRFAAELRPATATSLAGSLGAQRRLVPVDVDLADVRLVRDALGGTVNDVVLTIVSRGLRDLLLHRGEQPGPDSVHCLVPVAVPRGDDPHRAGNSISVRLVHLPVDKHAAADAHRVLTRRTTASKAGRGAQAGDLAQRVAEHLPVTAINAAIAAALRVPQRVVTTVVTNVPGPRGPQTLLGRELRALHPYVPLADHIRVAVAVTSYADHLMFGISSDRDAVPDVAVLAHGIEDGMAELVKAATGSTQPSPVRADR